MARVCPIALVIWFAAAAAAQEEIGPKPAQPAKQHTFLKQFVGRWECDGEAYIVPDQPPVQMKSTMTGHLIGDFWAVVVVEAGKPEMPYMGQGTYGYDTRKKQYIGTWTDSMSDYLWRYENGVVEGNKLILHSRGPDPFDPSKMVKARDTWEFKGQDMLVITGEMEGDDGKLRTMMRATCKRVKKQDSGPE